MAPPVEGDISLEKLDTPEQRAIARARDEGKELARKADVADRQCPAGSCGGPDLMAYTKTQTGGLRCTVCNEIVLHDLTGVAVGCLKETHEATSEHKRRAILFGLSTAQRHALLSISAYGSIVPCAEVTRGTLRSLLRRGIVETFEAPRDGRMERRWRLSSVGEWASQHNGHACTVLASQDGAA